MDGLSSPDDVVDASLEDKWQKDRPQFEAVGICHKCTRRKGLVNCTAFPDGIPTEIMIGEVMHTKPYSGDHGLLFEQAFS
jgi:hypothetical protein